MGDAGVQRDARAVPPQGRRSAVHREGAAQTAALVGGALFDPPSPLSRHSSPPSVKEARSQSMSAAPMSRPRSATGLLRKVRVMRLGRAVVRVMLDARRAPAADV